MTSCNFVCTCPVLKLLQKTILILQEFTSFEWLCQDLEDPEPIDWTNSFPAPKEPDPAQNPDKGGCFGHGPGTISQ